MKRRSLFIIFFINLLFIAQGQVKFGHAQSLIFKFDNDVFVSTDKYYSNGLRLTYNAPKFINIFSRGESVQQRFTLNHKIFTPTLFNKETINFDRPFVSLLAVHFQSIQVNSSNKTRITHHLGFGIQGRNSGGKTIQNFIHGLLPASEQIEDWQYQMSTDLIVNYKISFEKELFRNPFFMFNALIIGSIGTPSTTASFGTHVRLGKLFDRFKYTDYGGISWTFFLYTKPMINLNAYDTLLQGGLLSKDDPYVLSKINHLNYEVQSGAFLGIQKWTFDLGYIYQSPLAKPLSPHHWGSLSVGYLIN